MNNEHKLTKTRSGRSYKKAYVDYEENVHHHSRPMNHPCIMLSPTRAHTHSRIHPRTTNSQHFSFTNALTHSLTRWLRHWNFHNPNIC